MPNHVHLSAVPESEDGLQRAIGEAHRWYTRRVNFRAGWRGHLWQGRFASFPMDERYLYSDRAVCGTQSCVSEACRETGGIFMEQYGCAHLWQQ